MGALLVVPAHQRPEGSRAAPTVGCMNNLVEGVDVTRRTQGSSAKQCNESGCDKLVRARGLCSTHYNQQHLVARHAVVASQCKACGDTVRREARHGRRFVCSVKCRSVLSDHSGGSCSWAGRRGVASLELRLHRGRHLGGRDDLRLRQLDLLPLGQSVNRNAYTLDPRAHAVHHVVSLGQGGAHTPANVRCACHGCSGRKSRRSHPLSSA